ncbi:hypothetical protein AMTRI_Chr06g192290 [Amborella trichopoda]
MGSNFCECWDCDRFIFMNRGPQFIQIAVPGYLGSRSMRSGKGSPWEMGSRSHELWDQDPLHLGSSSRLDMSYGSQSRTTRTFGPCESDYPIPDPVAVPAAVPSNYV